MSVILKERIFVPNLSYGMFSSEGNSAVHGIVVTVRANPGKLSWADIQNSLIALSDSDSRFGEANDTAVREYVYDLCVCYTSDFYDTHTQDSK